MLPISKLSSALAKKLEQLIIWSQPCLICESINQQAICTDCYLSLPQIKEQTNLCSHCLLPLTSINSQCQNCNTNNFYFTTIVAAFAYQTPLKQLLHQLKYYARLEYVSGMSQIFYQQLKQQLTIIPDAILPVPLHPKKQHQRGFNQVDELLREFKRHHPKIPVIQAKRIKNTQQQAQLNRAERLTNLQNAFSLNTPLNNQHIAIVDDVVTSATTVNELAKTCLSLGAKRVDVWCFLRAQDHLDN